MLNQLTTLARQLPGIAPFRDQANTLLDSLSRDSRNPMHVVAAHDLGNAIGNSGMYSQTTERAATDLGRESQRVLQGVHPMLWHYGEHGEFPQ